LGSWSCIELQATKKIADAKLAKDFQAVLKEFQKAQRLAVEREAAYAPFVSQAGLPQRWFAAQLCLRCWHIIFSLLPKFLSSKQNTRLGSVLMLECL
jgi:hypothetical protein